MNEVSRVEPLCKELAVPLLATDAIASVAGTDDLVEIDRRSLRGVSSKKALFTLKRCVR